MGDMADFALEDAWDEVEQFEQYKDSNINIQYEEGLINEVGALIGNPFSLPLRRGEKCNG